MGARRDMAGTTASTLLQWLGDRLVCADGALPVDALVVLGGAPRYRAPTAVRALRSGGAPVVVAVGGRDGSLGEVWRTDAVFQAMGVSAHQRVRLTTAAPGTAEEARVAVGWASAHGLTSLGVVTSAYHTRRAGFLFRRRARRVGIRICMIVADEDPFEVAAWWTNPRSRSLVLAEYGKAAWWSLAGRHR